MKKRLRSIVAILAMLSISHGGCHLTNSTGEMTTLATKLEEVGTKIESAYDAASSVVESLLGTENIETKLKTQAIIAWDRTIPEYDGNPYVDFPVADSVFEREWKEMKPGEIILSEFDSLGRCGPAIIRATKETMPKVERGSTGLAKPSGWVQNKYPGIVDSDPPYLYNRAHLLMWAISGLTDETRNLITGTRYFNTVCMLPTEIEVAQFIERSGQNVLYRVTPVFIGDNLLASGVLMEAESEDHSFQIRRFAFNVQPGVVIDYVTGNNWIVEGNENLAAQEETTYVLNTNTRKFHYPDCDSVREMNTKNRQDFTGTRQEIIDMGYNPCGACSP